MDRTNGYDSPNAHPKAGVSWPYGLPIAIGAFGSILGQSVRQPLTGSRTLTAPRPCSSNHAPRPCCPNHALAGCAESHGTHPRW